MSTRTPIRSSDLRGAARLATDATAGLTDLVEAVHQRIARWPRVPGLPDAAADGRTSGITGLVYRTIRGVTRVVGGSIDALLGALQPALETGTDESSAEREALLAALNGVLGDYLLATANPLATVMSLRRNGKALDLGAETGGRPLVLIHGLCMNDRQWTRDGHDHGAALARDGGYTPVYVRYNSGLHVSINGRLLAQQLERLVRTWPRPIEGLVLLGHSMGGLLARSAHAQALQAGMGWARALTDMVFLGTPHHGAPLERAGHGVDILLEATPYAAPFARLGKLRSAGITDLRHGNLLDEDWVGRDRFARGADRRLPVPLPAGVRCYTMAACLRQQPGPIDEQLLGDGLVPLASALGRHRDPARCLAFAADRQSIAEGLGHLALLGDRGVYAQLARWIAR